MRYTPKRALDEKEIMSPHTNNNNGDDGDDSSDPLKIFSNAIIPDLPLLMHGSGDAAQVDPGTTSILAELVSLYVYDLVQAAVNAHDVLTDGAGGLLPPPPPPHINVANDDDDDDDDDEHDDEHDDDDFNRNHPWSRKRRRRTDERKREDNWERPLPRPKIAKTDAKGGPNQNPTLQTIGYDPRRNISSLPPSSLPYAVVPYDDSQITWQGARGVNLFPNRIRKYYATTPTTIGPKCFIYPISHDAQLYNRVTTLLTEQKDFSDVMVNPAVLKVAQDDCDSILGNAVFGWVGLKDGDRRKDNGNGGGGEDGINGDAGNLNEGGASMEVEEKRRALAKSLGLEVQWPGLVDLLPTHHETKN